MSRQKRTPKGIRPRRVSSVGHIALPVWRQGGSTSCRVFSPAFAGTISMSWQPLLAPDRTGQQLHWPTASSPSLYAQGINLVLPTWKAPRQELPPDLPDTVRASPSTVIMGNLAIAILMVTINGMVGGCTRAALCPVSACATCASAFQVIWSMINSSMSSVPAAGGRRSPVADMGAFILLMIGFLLSLYNLLQWRSALFSANASRGWTAALPHKGAWFWQDMVFYSTVLVDAAALGCGPFIVFPSDAAAWMICVAYCVLFIILSVVFGCCQDESLDVPMVRLLSALSQCQLAKSSHASKQAIWTGLCLCMQSEEVLRSDSARPQSRPTTSPAAARPPSVSFVGRLLLSCRIFPILPQCGGRLLIKTLLGLQSLSAGCKAHKQECKSLQAGRPSEQCHACTCRPTTHRRLGKRLHGQVAPQRQTHLGLN